MYVICKNISFCTQPVNKKHEVVYTLTKRELEDANIKEGTIEDAYKKVDAILEDYKKKSGKFDICAIVKYQVNQKVGSSFKMGKKIYQISCQLSASGWKMKSIGYEYEETPTSYRLSDNRRVMKTKTNSVENMSSHYIFNYFMWVTEEDKIAGLTLLRDCAKKAALKTREEWMAVDEFIDEDHKIGVNEEIYKPLTQEQIVRLEADILKDETPEFCDPKCEFLNPTEADQDKMKFKGPHMCNKYLKEVRHRQFHPELIKLDECLGSDEEYKCMNCDFADDGYCNECEGTDGYTTEISDNFGCSNHSSIVNPPKKVAD